MHRTPMLRRPGRTTMLAVLALLDLRESDLRALAITPMVRFGFLPRRRHKH